MSDFSSTTIGKRVKNLDVSPQFGAYSGVEIVVDENTSYFAGNRTGRVITVNNPWGTQQQANNIISALQGFQYQPLRADGALANPAAEIGDGVSVSGVYSGIFKMSKNFSSLMASDIAAPQDEEVDHEYPFEPQSDRVYKRGIAENKAQIAVTASAITAEVSRATNAENSLRSAITVTANEINANVVKKTGGKVSTFGWSLTDTQWTLSANNRTVLKATSAGIEINGKVTATSGYIGNGSSGFTISSRAIYNGVTSLSDAAHSGVYVGTDGIVCGKGAFKVTSAGAVTATNLTINGGSINLGNGAFRVTSAGAVTASNLSITGGSISMGSNFYVNSSGNVTANNMTLNGTLTVGGAQITAEQLRVGAAAAYSGAGGWNGATNWVNSNGSYCYGGASGGYLANNAFNNNQQVNYMKATYLTCTSGWFTVGGASASWQQRTFVTGVRVNFLTQNVFTTQGTIYYLGRSS